MKKKKINFPLQHKGCAAYCLFARLDHEMFLVDSNSLFATS